MKKNIPTNRKSLKAMTMKMRKDNPNLIPTASPFRAVVKVPGTSANCGPGFDCLGLATTIYNYLDLTLVRANKIIVESKGTGSESIPHGRRNLAWQAVRRLLQEVGREDEF